MTKPSKGKWAKKPSQKKAPHKPIKSGGKTGSNSPRRIGRPVTRRAQADCRGKKPEEATKALQGVVEGMRKVQGYSERLVAEGITHLPKERPDEIIHTPSFLSLPPIPAEVTSLRPSPIESQQSEARQKGVPWVLTSGAIVLTWCGFAFNGMLLEHLLFLDLVLSGIALVVSWLITRSRRLAVPVALICFAILAGASLVIGKRTIRIQFTGPYPNPVKGWFRYNEFENKYFEISDGQGVIQNVTLGSHSLQNNQQIEVKKIEVGLLDYLPWIGQELIIAYDPAAWAATGAPSATPPPMVPTPTPKPSDTPPPSSPPTEPPSVPGAAASSLPKPENLIVPEGKFFMGLDSASDDPQVRARFWYDPAHEVKLSEYSIDVYEVTNLWFWKCIQAGQESDDPKIGCHPAPTAGADSNDPYEGYRLYGDNYPEYPVVFVTWDEATEFCRWVGGELPTEAQWERAAGYDLDGRRREFPWGNGGEIEDYANVGKELPKTGDMSPQSTLKKVNAFENGRSYLGLYNMAGNVWEWVRDWFQKNYYKSIHGLIVDPLGPTLKGVKGIRGGSFTAKSDWEIYTYRRYFQDPNARGVETGFRCVYPGST